jgi:glycine cleavage system T protein (aminomethyltransferase)
MPIPSPLHSRTSKLCAQMAYKEWAGFLAPSQYGVSVDPEYFAFRETAGLIDVTPLFKYEIKGPDALRLLDRIFSRDLSKLKVGRVAYGCWCDEKGMVVDDGNVFHLEENLLWLTAANPSYLWLDQNSFGLDVSITDITESVAGMALQGPRSRRILNSLANKGLDDLSFFGCRQVKVGKIDVWLSRTGYTGDLGYEIWVENKKACALWDAIMEAGAPHCIKAAGLNALDIARLEAGYILIGVDFRSSLHCLTRNQMSTPFEIGLGWAVNTDGRPFTGQRALIQLKQEEPKWQLVGLEVDMEQLEHMFDQRGLPVQLPCTAWRETVPVYNRTRRQIGYCSSGTWSPLLKKYICLATLESKYAELGTKVKMETLIDLDREFVTARVTERPFFAPKRLKSMLEEPRPAELASQVLIGVEG